MRVIPEAFSIFIETIRAMRVGRMLTAVFSPSFAPAVKLSKYPLFPKSIKQPEIQMTKGMASEEIYSSIFKCGDSPFS